MFLILHRTRHLFTLFTMPFKYLLQIFVRRGLSVPTPSKDPRWVSVEVSRALGFSLVKDPASRWLPVPWPNPLPCGVSEGKGQE